MMCAESPRDPSDACWKITETNRLDNTAVDRLGSAFLVGNGYIGYRGTLEEDTKDQLVATIVSGLYDKAGDLWREPVNLPNPCSVQSVYHDAPLHARTSEVERHTQTLDLFRGLHERDTTFKAADGNLIRVSAMRFVSLAALHLLCLRYTVEASRDCTLAIRCGIDGDVWDLNGPHLGGYSSSVTEEVASLTARTREKGINVAVSQCVAAPGAPVEYLHEEKRILSQFELPLSAGVPRAIVVYSALNTGMDTEDPLSESRALSREASRVGFDRLLEEHCARWETRWMQCDIGVDGDREAQLAVRFSMYHLLAAAPAHTARASIPARGLSGQMYKGAIFWDTEIFMLPFFTHVFPELARNLLMYRYHTLEGARRKAREYGFRGAFYAWESQDTGDDACTLFNVTDVFTNRPMRTYFRDKQIHISADVVYAYWRYFSATADDSILFDGGAEVIYECCRFLLTYLYYSRERDRYEILDVTGPDEYHERVHNNAYTNRIAAHAFEVCRRVSAYLEDHYPDTARALLEKLSFRRDLEAIREVNGRIYLPQPEPCSSIIPQFDGYFALEDASVEELLLRKLHPHEYLGGGNGLASSTQVIKQADVILALSLFSGDYSREIRAANWQYYEPRTEHGSSLSACAYALVAADIGKIEEAYRYFMKAATADLAGEPKSHVGTLYIGGTHPAASGGAWMAVVLGLCGIGFSQNAVTIEPRLPDHWAQVSVPLVVRGRRLHIAVCRRHVSVQAAPAPAEGERINVRVEDRTYELPETGSLSIELS
jgi:nigerose phosphorylase